MKHCKGIAAHGSAPRTLLAFADELAVPLKLQTALETDSEFKLLCISSNLTRIVDLAAESHPHAALFWFRDTTDLAILDKLRRAAPDMAIVLCVPYDLPPETARKAVDLGVRAFLSTTAAWATFKECLRLATGDQRARSKAC